MAIPLANMGTAGVVGAAGVTGAVEAADTAEARLDPTQAKTGEALPEKPAFTASGSGALPEAALFVMDSLEAADFEAWAVGGCVRDMVLGRPRADIDIATSASVQQMHQVFESERIKPSVSLFDTGAKHGTVTVVVDGQAFETTTYRVDGAYSDGRHPDQVRFVRSIQEDLARRDFTVNAMAFHPLRGFVDPYGGMQDAQAGVIRAVGEPLERFQEDALRVLRGCRFSAQLGFRIEDATFAAMLRSKRLLAGVSRERITAELTKLLVAPYAGDALLGSVDVLAAVLPELVAMKGFQQHSPYHIYDVLEHTARAVDGVRADPLVRWAALLHDVGKPAAFFLDEAGIGHFYGHPAISRQIAEGVLARMSLGAKFRAQLLALVEQHDRVVDAAPRAVKRVIHVLDDNPELFRALCELKRGDARAQAPEYASRVDHANALELVLDEILTEGQALTVRDLAIDGNDVMELGLRPGPRVGEVLRACFDAVSDDVIPNEREPLLRFARKLVE